MGHMGQKHGDQPLIQESVAQLRQLDRAACVICGTIAIAEQALRLGIHLWVIFSRVDSQVIRMLMQASPIHTHLYHLADNSAGILPGWQSTSEHSSAGTSFSQNMTSSCSPVSAQPQRRPSRVVLSPGTLLRGQRASRDPSVVTSPGCLVPILLPPSAGGSSQGFRQKCRMKAGETHDLIGRIL